MNGKEKKTKNVVNKRPFEALTNYKAREFRSIQIYL